LVKHYAGQLNQVFINILSNAIDALQQHPRERSAKGEASLMPAEIKNNPSHNRLGMEEAIPSRIFDRFFMTKAVGEGTGLGLSITYQIVVDKHGGRLECILELGQEAEF
jgi:signal transduction histidine kinase